MDGKKQEARQADGERNTQRERERGFESGLYVLFQPFYLPFYV